MYKKNWSKSPASKSLALLVLLGIVYLATPMPPPVTAQKLELLESSSETNNETAQEPVVRPIVCDDTSNHSLGATNQPFGYGCIGAADKLVEPVVVEPEPVRVAVVFNAPTAQPAPTPVHTPANVEQWRGLVATYFAPQDVELALLVIGCESEGDAGAVNPSSGAAGLFQHIPRYWAERSASAGVGGADIFDPAANVAVAAYLVYSDGWWHWNASAHCW